MILSNWKHTTPWRTSYKPKMKPSWKKDISFRKILIIFPICNPSIPSSNIVNLLQKKILPPSTPTPKRSKIGARPKPSDKKSMRLLIIVWNNLVSLNLKHQPLNSKKLLRQKNRFWTTLTVLNHLLPIIDPDPQQTYKTHQNSTAQRVFPLNKKKLPQESVSISNSTKITSVMMRWRWSKKSNEKA